MSRENDLEKALAIGQAALKTMDAALVAAQEKVEAYETLMDTKEAVTVSAASKILGWAGPIKEFRRWLIDTEEIFVEWNKGLKAFQYKPFKKEKSHAYYVVDIYNIPTERGKMQRVTTKITPEGLDYLRKKLKKYLPKEDDE